MSIGVGQILVIIVVVVFLFGRLPSISKDLTAGVNNIRTFIKDLSQSTPEDSTHDKTLQEKHINDKKKN